MKKALNLGCGNMPYASTDDVEWINIEKIYIPGHSLCSWDDSYKYINAEMQDIDKYYDAGSIDLIHIVHALEHVSTDDSRKTLDACARVLKPGGIIEIETPDIDKACRHWLDGNQTDRIMGLFWGTMGADGEGQFHLTGFNRARYVNELSGRGFTSIEEIQVGEGHGRPEPQYDIRVRAVR